MTFKIFNNSLVEDSLGSPGRELSRHRGLEFDPSPEDSMRCKQGATNGLGPMLREPVLLQQV